jgi:periplasmic protein CpxP/Spy
MKKLIVLTAACALALPPLAVYAEKDHHPEKQKTGADMPAQGQPPMGGMMKGGMMGKMQEHMKKMMQQMDAIHKADDAKKRDKLLQEHMQSMQEGMKMMRGMGGGMMKGMMGKGDSGMMMGKGGGMMKGGDMPMRHRALEQRVDMMQMMMEQMMRHRQAEESPPKSGKSK